MADIAKLFGAAESKYKKAEAEYRKAGEALESLRVQMLKHLGTSASRIGVGSGATSRGGRSIATATSPKAPREGTLGAFVIQVMKDGKERGPAEVYPAVMKAGFKSKGTEKSRLVMVTQTMAKLASRGTLTRKSHGVYTFSG